MVARTNRSAFGARIDRRSALRVMGAGTAFLLLDNCGAGGPVLFVWSLLEAVFKVLEEKEVGKPKPAQDKAVTVYAAPPASQFVAVGSGTSDSQGQVNLRFDQPLAPGSDLVLRVGGESSTASFTRLSVTAPGPQNATETRTPSVVINSTQALATDISGPFDSLNRSALPLAPPAITDAPTTDELTATGAGPLLVNVGGTVDPKFRNLIGLHLYFVVRPLQGNGRLVPQFPQIPVLSADGTWTAVAVTLGDAQDPPLAGDGFDFLVAVTEEELPQGTAPEPTRYDRPIDLPGVRYFSAPTTITIV